jgi:chromosome segregation ATPase
MIVVILGAIAFTCLAIGVLIVWRALSLIPREDEIVLKKEYDEKQEALEQALRIQEMTKADSQDLKNKLVMAREMSEAAKKESDQIVHQLKEVNAKASEYERRAAEASEKIKVFEAKAAEAVQKANMQASGCAETVRALQTELNELKQKENSYQGQIKALEEKMVIAQKTASQAREAQGADDVKKMNEQLAGQNKLVQAELVKARARAQGLEKICTDYQSQLEEILKRSQGAV